jgi:hypothetical protein
VAHELGKLALNENYFGFVNCIPVPQGSCKSLCMMTISCHLNLNFPSAWQKHERNLSILEFGGLSQIVLFSLLK